MLNWQSWQHCPSSRYGKYVRDHYQTSLSLHKVRKYNKPPSSSFVQQGSNIVLISIFVSQGSHNVEISGFSVTHILREINFQDSRSCKTSIFAI